MVDTATIIEWILIVLVFGLYFAIPFIMNHINNPESRVKTLKTLNISYLVVTIALIGYIVYELCVFQMEGNFMLSRIALIVISKIMYCYHVFVKTKQWTE